MAYTTAQPHTGRRLGVAVLVGVLLAGALYLTLSLTDLRIPLPDFVSGEPFEDVGPTVVESIQALSELTTAEMVEYTTIEKGEDYGWLNWARGDRIFLFAVARLGAGVDLEKLEPDSFAVDNETGTVVVQLPTAEVFYTYLDNEATTVYDRDTGLFTSGDVELESDARKAAEAILLEQGIRSGLLEEAQHNAEMTISEFLHGLGYTRVIMERAPSP